MSSITYFKSLHHDARKVYVRDVIKRCCDAWGVDEPYEIEDKAGNRGLGYNAGAIKMWYSRPTMPWDFVLTTAMRQGVSLDYLLLNVNEDKKLEKSKPEDLLAVFNEIVVDTLEDCAEFGIVEHEYVHVLAKKLSKELEERLTDFSYSKQA